MSLTKEKNLMSSVLSVCCFCLLIQGSLQDETTKETLDSTNWMDINEKYLACLEFLEIESVIRFGNEISRGISEEEIQTMLEECNSTLLRRKKRQSGGELLIKDFEQFNKAARDYNIIFPGTKWCGKGNIAANDSDLGTEADTDMCCRAHDMCNDTILAGESAHGLTNDGQYTALNCRCDNELYDCLSNVNTLTSNTVGNLYFNILRSRCFKEDYPRTNKCKTYSSRLHLTCLEYEKDTTKPMVYQWFPAKTYRNIPIIDEKAFPARS